MLGGLELDLGGLLVCWMWMLDGAWAWAAGRLAACFCSFVECLHLQAWSWTWELGCLLVCWILDVELWMVRCLSAWAAGRLAGWLPAFVVLWNAWRLGAGLGTWL